MDIFQNRNFLRLFFAAFTSQMGTTVGNLAFAFFLLDRFSSQPVYTTIAELMYSLPTIFVFFIVGVVADRFDRKKVAENCDWIRAGLTVVLFFVLFLESIPLVLFVLFIRSAVTKFFFPAEASLVQAILRKDQYVKAAGLNQMLFSLFMLFGVGLGAFMYKTIGLHGAIALDFISFIISGLLIRSCDIPIEARQPNGKNGWKNSAVKDSMHDFKEGIVYILKSKLLASLVFGYFVFGFVSGGLAVLPMFKMKYILSPESYEWHTSLFTIVLGSGLLIGAVTGALLAKKVKPEFLMSVPILIAGAFIILLGFTDQLIVYYAAAFLAGTCIGPVNTALGGWIPKIVHPRLMGRVSGWTDPLMMIAQSSALGLIALLFPAMISNINYIYYGLAATILLAGLYYFITLPKLSIQTAEIDVHETLKRQKNTKAKMNSIN
ncbi:MFS transporter [Bacillus sp. WMMC1349]|uniref:MFS transporter n=1 Tax=Bacillus sp. WMMC1349 TaxID=2736254 RepID=UPI0015558536|nr:MFS transporter [Bacillus sp. WMMC1349]NPC92367.1 MFS transporter [Bacillus sp. WMMC1349]